ncbi:MAG TPA: nitroreductase family protein [Aggregatilineaceae bacterium]|nr:nitroreductase family protein [Aggregatilineaceae bacterium]
MQSRRSIRRYQDRSVPDDSIRRLLDAAIWAPSAHNRQPWRFAVIVDPERRASLAQAMGQPFRTDLEAEGLAAEAVEQQLTRSYQRISQAPALILLFLSMTQMDQHSSLVRQQGERILAIQSVALAAQNLILAAHAEGLGACWMCAPLFCPDVVRAELDLPADWEAQALITLGYPAQERVSERDLVETKTLWY